MSSYRFSHAERYAVFTVHKEKCWLCGEPITLAETEIDHVIPETIDAASLAEETTFLGLPSDFNVNSFVNWLPAHRSCNAKKSNAIFRPSPLIQNVLETLIERAPKARILCDGYLTDRKIDNVVNLLLAAQQDNLLKPRHRAALVAFVASYHEKNREPEQRGKPLTLGPGLTIIGGDEHRLILRGPSGLVGGRSMGDRLHPSWDCPNCGVTGWNGVRCIICGMMDDGD